MNVLGIWQALYNPLKIINRPKNGVQITVQKVKISQACDTTVQRCFNLQSTYNSFVMSIVLVIAFKKKQQIYGDIFSL